MISMKLTSVVLSSLLAISVYSQNRYQTIADRNICLHSNNAAAIASFSDSIVSVAGVSYLHTSGDWHDYNEAECVNGISAEVKSYLRLTPSVVSFGQVSYYNGSEHDREGSFLYDDGLLKPFDIVDDTVSVIGDKHTEFIGVSGAVGWSVVPEFSLGARVDYNVGSFVKYKDLRHTNTYMRLDASLGVYSSGLIADVVDLGLAAQYRRRAEGVEFKIFGTNDIIYKSYIDYANFMGVVETYGSEGFIEQNGNLPLLSQYIGGSLQIGIHILDNIDWINDVAFLSRDGFYGKKSQFSISYAKWTGNEFSVSSRLVARYPSCFHLFKVGFVREYISANRNVYRRENVEYNASMDYYKYYTPFKMNDKLQVNAHIAYSGYFSPVSEYYKWQLDAGVDFFRRDQTAYIFPVYCRQRVNSYRPFISLSRRFFVADTRHIIAEVTLDSSIGNGTKFNQGSLSDILHDDSLPSVHYNYLNHNYEFLTQSQLGCRVLAGYNWTLANMPHIRPLVSASYSHQHALSHNYVDGKIRHSFMINLSFEF